ncbi:Protein CBG00821 [Caenorhabditis briggsae]|uniref:Sodium/hydrogen exchanger n=2 Tax=Caenorhabditis briggsae TaxID=6238 RepID=A8WNX1_CAEBR|nr:Protein CBG00821 [Caenorhabditis briggsae]CAP22177.2 Protein CBG00821 [Caenorhabditis briggsae]
MFPFKWTEVQFVYTIAIWILIASLARICKTSGQTDTYRYFSVFSYLKFLTKWLPDSSLIIIVGLILGFILHLTSLNGVSLDAEVFFLYLLPPIIFDAGYFMPNRAFFKNIDSILLFSVLGTVWNCFAIGGSLLLLSKYDIFSIQFSTFEIFIFASLVSASDPVAIIVVFEEIHVNEFLFINVFGEALFNDAISVVLYNMFISFLARDLTTLNFWDYASRGLSFFVVASGGVAIGVVFAFATSLATKYTHGIKIVAPVLIFLIPYMGYLTAEMVSFSAIIAIAVCGMVMKQYVKGNITNSAANSVKYFTKIISQTSEIVIYMFLGLSTVSADHYFDVVFIAATIFFTLFYRTIGVLSQCYFLNKFRAEQFKLQDQFILAYGGLKGAIAYGLVVSIPAAVSAKPMFITTTIALIYFNVFIQGITIRPLINLLKIKTKEEKKATMTESVYNKYLDYMMAGIEDIAGQKGHYNLVARFERFNSSVLKPIFMRLQKREKIDFTSVIRSYEKLILEDALEKMKSRQNSTEISLRSFLQPGEDMEQLYTLFGEFLKERRDDDIQDDYFAEVQAHECENFGSELKEIENKDASIV